MFDFVYIVTADDIRRMPPDRFRKMIRSLLILYGIALVGVVLACVLALEDGLSLRCVNILKGRISV